MQKLDKAQKSNAELLDESKKIIDFLSQKTVDLSQKIVVKDSLIENQAQTIESQQIALDLHANFKSVLRYCEERGLVKSVKERIAMGRALSKISKANGLEIHKVKADDPSGRYEFVQSYVARAFEIYEIEQGGTLWN
jgi:hypothetical protein